MRRSAFQRYPFFDSGISRRATGPRYGLRWLLLGSLMVVTFGCAQWSKEQNQTAGPVLPKPQKSLDSVVVETVLVRFPESKLAEFQEAWHTVDETYIDIETRQALDRNGLRVGLVIGELPKAIRDQIAATSRDQNTDALEHAGLAADADNKTHLLQCRAGRRKELFVRKELAEPLTVLSNIDGAAQGEVYDKATVLFDLRAVPHGNKQATLELIPEILHGELRQTYVSSEFGLRPEMRKERKAWTELRIAARLSPGQILVVAGTQPSKAVGRAFFTTETAQQTEEHVMLLLRVVETQLDELFAPEELGQAQAMAER